MAHKPNKNETLSIGKSDQKFSDKLTEVELKNFITSLAGSFEDVSKASAKLIIIAPSLDNALLIVKHLGSLIDDCVNYHRDDKTFDREIEIDERLEEEILKPCGTIIYEKAHTLEVVCDGIMFLNKCYEHYFTDDSIISELCLKVVTLKPNINQCKKVLTNYKDASSKGYEEVMNYFLSLNPTANDMTLILNHLNDYFECFCFDESKISRLTQVILSHSTMSSEILLKIADALVVQLMTPEDKLDESMIGCIKEVKQQLTKVPLDACNINQLSILLEYDKARNSEIGEKLLHEGKKGNDKALCSVINFCFDRKQKEKAGAMLLDAGLIWEIVFYGVPSLQNRWAEELIKKKKGYSMSELVCLVQVEKYADVALETLADWLCNEYEGPEAKETLSSHDYINLIKIFLVVDSFKEQSMVQNVVQIKKIVIEGFPLAFENLIWLLQLTTFEDIKIQNFGRLLKKHHSDSYLHSLLDRFERPEWIRFALSTAQFVLANKAIATSDKEFLETMRKSIEQDNSSCVEVGILLLIALYFQNDKSWSFFSWQSNTFCYIEPLSKS